MADHFKFHVSLKWENELFGGLGFPIVNLLNLFMCKSQNLPSLSQIFFLSLQLITRSFSRDAGRAGLQSCVVLILCTLCVFLFVVTLRRSPHGKIHARPWQPAWIRWVFTLRLPAIMVVYRGAPWPCHSQTSVRIFNSIPPALFQESCFLEQDSEINITSKFSYISVQ